MGDEHKQAAFLAHVDVAAVEAFIASDDKIYQKDFQSELLTALCKYHDQLTEKMAQELPTQMQWIVFKPEHRCKCSGEQQKAKDAEVPETIRPMIIRFDASTGRALDEQD